VGDVRDFLNETSETIAQTKGYKIIEKKVMRNHIHLFIEADPFESPIGIVKIFKGISSSRLQKKFPELRNNMWRGVLWSP